jgi:hypothetical protein
MYQPSDQPGGVYVHLYDLSQDLQSIPAGKAKTNEGSIKCPDLYSSP